MPNSFQPNQPIPHIVPAQLDWQTDDQGHTVPISQAFGDVYYSMVDGLAESRYVFVEQNYLSERFNWLFSETLQSPATSTTKTFTITELGFGTGLNLLATWQLWQEVKAHYANNDTAAYTVDRNIPRLHFISTEKFPLTKADLTRSLKSWQTAEPTLAPLIKQLIALYPVLVPGCHRLHLADDVTLDLWLGDAADSLSQLDNSYGACVDAWFLDGFAPSCNEALWAQQIFEQLQRLSKPGTTVATFSCAGVVKRGLKSAGFDIQKVKGFGRKREMLTATLPPPSTLDKDTDSLSAITTTEQNALIPATVNRITIIGAGISGLMSAWSLAQRGTDVLLLDQSAPLSGASGNPRALLAPKMTPIHHVAEHLHSIGYLYSARLYQALDRANNTHGRAPIFEATGALDLLTKANIDTEQIADYPDEMATTLSASEAKLRSNLAEQDLDDNLYLPQAGLVNPQALATTVLAHPLIRFEQRDIVKIEADNNKVRLYGTDASQLEADSVIIAAAHASCLLDPRIFDFRKIRGQLSWFTPEQLSKLPKLPLKFGGYCAPFVPQAGDSNLNPVTEGQPHFLLGASFVRNDTDTDIRDSEHQLNRDKLVNAIAELDEVIPKDVVNWQARAGIRAQTPDYHPLVGKVTACEDKESVMQSNKPVRIWTLSGMGSKGYAFAPICAEALADMITGSFAPFSQALVKRLSPSRARLQSALKR
ncbi:FAD-dependent 5-carboxymethylaminomethyl-2-thiouridine(34) oxidoreductase MnmC [Psychrobacter pygoscelis]|uniref:FAD-dependent 5-carboxymethylaminomethyl-2-thiouridine(34) oxidoreductase MnmC n=1 Tax=Psychrobacter pygoscelis TaxID=2488563 RepID=UPI00103E6FB7|nr:FAD-dependent 5-carboxymethylaminomethyl-2-thiouridine(34) oxidoreductase MnmC [Psychrobacter pygoscelis]